MVRITQQRHTLRAQPWYVQGSRHMVYGPQKAPRFPAHWLDIPDDSEIFEEPFRAPQDAFFRERIVLPDAQNQVQQKRVEKLYWLLYGLLALMIIGFAVALSAVLGDLKPSQHARFAQPLTFFVQGSIERLGIAPDGKKTLTVTDVNGRPSTVELDFDQTAVFQKGGPLSIAHLKIGQQVSMVHEKGLAKSIEILRQPLPTIMLR